MNDHQNHRRIRTSDHGKVRAIGSPCGRLPFLFAVVCLLTVLVQIILAPAPVSAREAFVINDYKIKMVVDDSNSYTITEDLDLFFVKERHGLIRNLPRYTYRGGSVEIKNVECDAPFTTAVKGNSFQIKIGDPDKYVSGDVHYRISYVYDIGKDGLNDMDEIYFNLVGTEWDTDIEHVGFEIDLPKPVSDRELNFTWGPKGSKEKAPLDLQFSERRITGSLTKPLDPHDGLTIALPLPEGYFDGPMRNGILWYQKYEKPMFYGYVSLALILLIVFFVTRLHIKPGSWKPDRGDIPRPPLDLTSSDVFFLSHSFSSTRSIVSLLLDWANRGLLRLDPVVQPDAVGAGGVAGMGPAAETGMDHGFPFGSDIVITFLNGPDARMRRYERTFWNKLMSYSDGQGHVYLSRLDTGLRSGVSRAARGVKRYWRYSKERVFSLLGPLVRFLLFLLSILPVSFLGFSFLQKMDIPLSRVSVLAVLGGSAILMTFTTLFSDAFRQWARPIRGRASAVIVGLIIVVILTVASARLADIALGPVQRIPFAIAFFAACIFFSLAHGMQVYTLKGRRRVKAIRDFVEFVTTPGQEVQNAVFYRDPAAFYAALPCAYAFGMADDWVARLQAVEAAGGQPTDPVYIQGPVYHVDLFRMMNDVLRTMDKLVQLGKPSQGSSGSSSGGSGGSSGGGSSGGGSGGGGGSSW